MYNLKICNHFSRMHFTSIKHTLENSALTNNQLSSFKAGRKNWNFLHIFIKDANKKSKFLKKLVLKSLMLRKMAVERRNKRDFDEKKNV